MWHWAFICLCRRFVCCAFALCVHTCWLESTRWEEEKTRWLRTRSQQQQQKTRWVYPPPYCKRKVLRTIATFGDSFDLKQAATVTFDSQLHGIDHKLSIRCAERQYFIMFWSWQVAVFRSPLPFGSYLPDTQ